MKLHPYLGRGLVMLVASCSFDPGVLAADASPDVAPDMPVPGCAAQVSSGGDHTCVRLYDGSIWCWGLAAYGQVGIMTLTTRCTANQSSPYCFPTPQLVAIPPAHDIALGGYHSCAATQAGTYCWGLNVHGAYGDGTNSNSVVPSLVPQRANPSVLGAGLYHTCSITSHDVLCSGQNAAGEVGNDSLVSELNATAVASGFARVALGDYTTCAIDHQQLLSCWGRNTYGQIDATLENKLVPTQIDGLTDVADVAVGRHHICVVQSDGAARCWGSNMNGQLGNGQSTTVSPPVLVTVSFVKDVTAERNATCVVNGAGDVYCFGEGYGSSPIKIALPRPAKQVSAGNAHVCAITDDTQVWCWGQNHYGQLGTGMSSDEFVAEPRHVTICP